jgi:hypothetical protein
MEKHYRLKKPLKIGTENHDKGAVVPESSFGPDLAAIFVERGVIEPASERAAKQAEKDAVTTNG